MSRFGGIKRELEERARPSPLVEEEASLPKAGVAKARQGKKAVIGYFSPELSRELRMLGIQENTSMQALLGEAIDLLMKARGKHPFGER